LTVASAVALALGLHAAAFANNQEDEAIRACKGQIEDSYDVDTFRNVWAEERGNHKYKIHGDVKYDHDRHPFTCVVKRGHVRSYHYDGPHPGLADDNDTAKAAAAVGVGLAIAAIIAKTAADEGSDKTHMEDECQEVLSYRLAADHHDSATFRITSSELDDDILNGEGNVRWEHAGPNRVQFSCLFQDHRVDDSNYVLY
jgi:hypothetical protein